MVSPTDSLPSIFDLWHDYVSHLERNPVVVEVGVQDGYDTFRLAAIAQRARLEMLWVGFEPDPRNVVGCRARGIPVEPYACSDADGHAELWLSDGQLPTSPGRNHTGSSSLQRPTAHLTIHPWCKFERRAVVRTVRLDRILPSAVCPDLIWADVQGAQRKFLAGAMDVLARAHWLYIECHSVPCYQDEPTYDELCALLPDWTVIHRWTNDVLLERSDGGPPVTVNDASFVSSRPIARLHPVRVRF